MQYCSTVKIADIYWQLSTLYALLQLSILYNWQFLYELLQLTTFVCTIAIEDNLCMHNFYWKHISNSISSFQLFIHYYNYRLLYAHLELTNFVCTIAIDNILCTIAIDNFLYAIMQLWNILCWKNNIKIKSKITYNNVHKHNSNIIALCNLLRTDTVV